MKKILLIGLGLWLLSVYAVTAVHKTKTVPLT